LFGGNNVVRSAYDKYRSENVLNGTPALDFNSNRYLTEERFLAKVDGQNEVGWAIVIKLKNIRRRMEAAEYSNGLPC
jgi:hypothetical protein